MADVRGERYGTRSWVRFADPVPCADVHGGWITLQPLASGIRSRALKWIVCPGPIFSICTYREIAARGLGLAIPAPDFPIAEKDPITR